MIIEEKIQQFETRLKSFESSISKLEGQRHILHTQIEEAKTKIGDLEVTEDLDKKAIVVLNLVQQASREKIKEAFENMVTFALKSVFQDNYQFKLEFGSRGQLGELEFKLKTPENNEFRGLEHCSAGGSLDVISLALRFVLLSVLRPKVEGFVVLDEPTKHLSRNYRENEYFFYKSLSEKISRQLIIISHSSELINMAENKILIGKE